MERCLYLDTARLGLMKPQAQRLYQDFVRFCGEGRFGLYWDEFLVHGMESLPDCLRRSYPDLEAWQGIGPFKESIKHFVGASPDSQVLLANRSAQLMKLAAKLFFRSCRNVLITDLTWPGFWKILRRERVRTGKRSTCMWIRRKVLNDELSAEELIDLVADSYVHGHCDGLFLPAVSNLGIKLPVHDIVQAIRDRAELRFTVVDGAQALAHTPLQLARFECDMFIAGGHKWLGAHHPVGFGFLRPSAAYESMQRESLQQAVCTVIKRKLVDDPLLKFTVELESGKINRYSETVNITPLLTAQGAVNDSKPESLPTVFRTRIDNADEVSSRAVLVGWKPIQPDASLRSGILLLRPYSERRTMPPAIIRRFLRDRGIASSVYPHGIVRLSMPDAPWLNGQLEYLMQSLGDL